MNTLFEPAARDALLARLAALRVDCARQWGRMAAAQMVAHCSAAIETATGDRPMKQKFIGKVLSPFVRRTVLGEAPFKRNSPTDPTFVIQDARNLDREKARLRELVERFAAHGPEGAGQWTHAFFGTLTGDEWGRLMYKHIDHHLRQFGL